MEGGDRGSRYAGKTNVVFIGNLPFDATEESLAEIFSAVGPVVGARLVYDRDTSRVRGFGFVEYHDPATASSAVRNLNGYELSGRNLRVDHAEPEKIGIGRYGPSRPGPNSPTSSGRELGGPGPTNIDPNKLPPGVPPPAGVTPADSITQTLATMPPRQLLDILVQTKSLITQSPEQARALLSSQPQLTYALFQVMLMLNAVDPSVLQRVSGGSSTSAPPPSAPPSQPPSHRPPPHSHHPQQAPHAPPQPPPQPQQQQQPVAPAAASLGGQSQEDLLKQVLELTDAQVNQLPPDQRAAALEIRRQARAAMS